MRLEKKSGTTELVEQIIIDSQFNSLIDLFQDVTSKVLVSSRFEI